MIKSFVNPINKKYSIIKLSKTTDVVIGSSTIYSIMGNTLNIEREALQKSIGGNDYKFCERVTWNNPGNRYAIAIGMNPSEMLPASLDLTNKKLTYALWKIGLYDGYYLFNVLPNIQSSKFKRVSPQFSILDIMSRIINRNIRAGKITNADIYIFWGSSFEIYSSEIKSINKIRFNSMFTIGSSSIQHTHPRKLGYANIQRNQRNKPLTLSIGKVD